MCIELILADRGRINARSSKHTGYQRELVPGQVSASTWSLEYVEEIKAPGKLVVGTTILFEYVAPVCQQPTTQGFFDEQAPSWVTFLLRAHSLRPNEVL